MSDSLWSHGLQYTRLPCFSSSPRVCSNSCPLSWWCIQPSHSLLPPSPTLNFSQSQCLFQWVEYLYQVSKDTGASASASVLSVNIAVQRTLKCFSIAPQFESMDRLPSTENLFSRTFPQSRLAPSQVSKGDCSPGFPTLVVGRKSGARRWPT